jgi:SAM-dependent methyltransferase
VGQSGEQNVTDHFDRWPFPGEDFSAREGLQLVRFLSARLNESDEGAGISPRIIDVGCGTGHTVLALARVFPDVAFVGFDISTKSLEIARRTAKERAIENITFEHGDLTQTMARLGQFQVVLSLGVLHHIANRDPAFSNLVQLTANGGCLCLWLYGCYGRMRHNLNQKFLRSLSAGLSSPERLSVANEFLSDLGEKFADGTGFYTPRGSGKEGIAFLQGRPQWLADQMIPAFEDPVSLGDILALFETNNLDFHKWLGVPTRLQTYTSSSILLEQFEKLPSRERLLAIDYLVKPEYYLVAGEKMAESGERK